MSVRSDARAGSVFAALADDTRRALLASIAASGGATATELAAGSSITRQAIAKHLAVLADAGLVASLRTGRETRFQVVPGSLRPASEWIAATDTAWSRRLGRLRQHLASGQASDVG
jgi:DNA-binding transcriptional ArsR family regulator